MGNRVTEADAQRGKLLVAPRDSLPTLSVLYLFSGVSRKASIAEELRKFCEAGGYGLRFHEVDILVGGSEHDLLDADAQEQWLARIG